MTYLIRTVQFNNFLPFKAHISVLANEYENFVFLSWQNIYPIFYKFF
jgi:hypothetical protein